MKILSLGRLLTLSAVAVCLAFGQKVDYIQQVQNKPVHNSLTYDWFRTVGVSITGDLSAAGAGKVITFTACPAGLATGDTIRVSVGTGTAEAVPITATTCTALGGTAGTVTITTSNAHTGSWKLGTASNGMQEAANVAAADADLNPVGDQPSGVEIPCGYYTNYGPVRISQDNFGIHAAKPLCVFISTTLATGNAFEFTGVSFVSIGGIQLYALGRTSGTGIVGNSVYFFHISDMRITGMPNGIDITTGYLVQIRDSDISGLKAVTGVGISYNGGADIRITDTAVEGDTSDPLNGGLQPLAGIQIISGGGIYLNNSSTLGCGRGLLVIPGAGQEATWGFVTNSIFDTGLWGVYFAPSSTGIVASWHFSNSWTASNWNDGVFGDAPDPTQLYDISFTSHRSVANRLNGIHFVNGRWIKILGSSFWGNSNVADNTATGIYMESNLSNVHIVNNTFGQAGIFTKTPAFHVVVGAGTGDYFVITGNDFTPPTGTAPLAFLATGINQVIHSNLGNETIPTVASAASVDPGQRGGSRVNITGTTNITTLTHPWDKREVTLIKIDAGSLSVGGGGNITTTSTLAQNTTVVCTYHATAWYCK